MWGDGASTQCAKTVSFRNQVTVQHTRRRPFGHLVRFKLKSQSEHSTAAAAVNVIKVIAVSQQCGRRKRAVLLRSEEISVVRLLALARMQQLLTLSGDGWRLKRD